MVALATALTFVLYGFATSPGVNAIPTSIANNLLARAAVYKLTRSISALTSLGISDNCQNAITALINAPAARCMNFPGTLAIISTVPGSSWIPPTNAWLSDFCAADVCTNDEISSTVSQAADACAAELAQYGISKDFLIQQAVLYYPTAKAAVCLRDLGNANDLCAITSLNNLQMSLGNLPLSPDVVTSRYTILTDNNFQLARQLSCTQCASTAFSLARPILPQQFLSTIDSFVGSQCGADFTSQQPSGTINVVTGTAALLAARATATTLSSSAQLSVGSSLVTTSIISALVAFVALF